MSDPSIAAALRELFSYLSPRRRWQFCIVLFLMLAGAVAELLSIGAVLPFLAVITDPEKALSISWLRDLAGWAGLETQSSIIIAITIIFAGSAILAAFVRLLLVKANQLYVFAVARDIGIAVYSRTLHQPYSFHTSRNSSEILAATNKAQLITGQLLLPLMQAACATVIGIFILIGLLFIDPIIALSAGGGFSLIYLIVMVATRKIMVRKGIIIARAQGERLQAVSEGLGGIRDVILDRSQSVFINRFAEIERHFRYAQATNNFLAQSPRFIVEGLGIVLIAGLALFLSLRDGGLMASIPLLGALALGAQRLVPLMQQLYSGWASFLGNGKMLFDVLDILRLPEAGQFLVEGRAEDLPFTREIVLENVSFSYPSSDRPAISSISLTIPKGGRVGFAGKTGSGKSTLMDIVLGLLTPTGGRILIDGVELCDSNRSAWQAHIAHVPQAIYLSDATLAENIAFGVPPEKIDHARVARAAEQAELAEVIEALPQGYQTFVGERGIRLSGGQRQRVGIARALYKQASILVFDEATSALDNETEKAVMDAINRLDRNLTILIIAHRLSTLDECDVVIDMNIVGGVRSDS